MKMDYATEHNYAEAKATIQATIFNYNACENFLNRLLQLDFEKFDKKVLNKRFDTYVRESLLNFQTPPGAYYTISMDSATINYNVKEKCVVFLNSGKSIERGGYGTVEIKIPKYEDGTINGKALKSYVIYEELARIQTSNERHKASLKSFDDIVKEHLEVKEKIENIYHNFLDNTDKLMAKYLKIDLK